MTFIDAAYVRTLGNIPEAAAELLAPHIESACLKVTAQIGALPEGGPDLDRAKDAAGCFAIAYALPTLNTFYLSEAEKVPRRVAQTDYVFHEPGELAKLVRLWEERAYNSMRAISRTGGSVGVAVI
ncbi:hypothetical protein [Synergistes jonesii]|uniref:hypothetical protein n=1 Tax=Synergistes jonesii TaxID=2754 RepID=UPI00248E3718|nr:hypothetical protein [Synergistes jonesii]